MEYGMNNKRVSFMDSDKRIADLMIRLKHDGLTKTKFFRAILTAYLERNENIINFIEEYKLFPECFQGSYCEESRKKWKRNKKEVWIRH